MTDTKQTEIRPPIVAILGHIDHGKSSLLDYIRKENTVSGEAGGITQHLGAYEAVVDDAEGGHRTITFLDTPGHEAFAAVRTRGASVADIAILIVAADDGVKAQTKEALTSIRDSKIPFVVAINKIDKPNANVEKVISDLAENEVYLEGRGGNVSFAEISATTGKGIPELLELVLLIADVSELSGDPSKNAEGFVVESHVDTKRGITGTLLIKDGVLSKGMYVAAGTAMAPVRSIESTLGKKTERATFSSPVHIVGWNKLPVVGLPFISFEAKKEAEHYCSSYKEETPGKQKSRVSDEDEERIVIPIVIKTDTAGGVDAVKHEIEKIKKTLPNRAEIKIIKSDVGSIGEADVKAIGGDTRGLILGFHTQVDRGVHELAERDDIAIAAFDIIYELIEWMQEEIKKRIPKETVEEVSGQAKVVKIFSQTGNKFLVGGKVRSGTLAKNSTIRIVRRENIVGEGSILELQKQRSDTDTVQEGEEFGMKIQTRAIMAQGDILESVRLVEK